ncbi:hypothetical protein [Cellulosilyticum sp. I15G10I2]|uniref:hypothetical protein n=1 Tax=Cellulosilyticum sp. I15G10I2 TaxID=1892843 RepID=UPI00085C3307|nr:hypothetical protein [Cellulosilyticum sp. I15G10I2]
MVTLEVKVFKDMIARVKATVAKEDTRPALTLINLIVENGILKLWSMNGYQVQIIDKPVESQESFRGMFSDLYIHSKDSYVEISRDENTLNFKYIPSGLQFSIPQDKTDKLEPFDLKNFTENVVAKKDYAIAIGREKLENALKKYKKTDRSDILIIRVDTSSALKEIEIINKCDDMKQTSYILPVRCSDIENYKD